MNNNICNQCGKEFKGNKRRKYCNEECRKERNREVDRMRKRKERKNLSEEQKRVIAKKKSEREKERRKEAKQARVCRVCEVEFIPNHNGTKTFDCSDKCYKEYRRKYNRIKMRESSGGGSNALRTKQCEWCGEDYTVPGRNAHRARFCSEKCNNTWWSRQKGHRPLEEWESLREEQKRKRQARLEKERAIRSLRTTLTKVIKLKEEEERIKELTRECVECGETFYDPNPVPLICSKKCMRKRNNRIRRLYNSKRFNKRNIVDKDITLEKLYERDGGLCHLCGTECEYDDKVITKEGHFIVGRYYPSIDHVKPLSKGGMHSWDNVKLAHHYCNTIKNDNDNRIEVKQQINRIKYNKRDLVL